MPSTFRRRQLFVPETALHTSVLLFVLAEAQGETRARVGGSRSCLRGRDAAARRLNAADRPRLQMARRKKEVKIPNHWLWLGETTRLLYIMRSSGQMRHSARIYNLQLLHAG
ncbi:hypothetical protein K431DRAFT_280428 [Polychaeton citri CBS 116435]|uniref:Uncharacterized protein n=1 Tax=Polychaeton citri CBS 116435 TaxID=1314669 RepID=A0A9P4QJ61_9PEZI|nr:hypothetical protein K431DRAFT_280428 [Polychaeton citri CBS 116435]